MTSFTLGELAARVGGPARLARDSRALQDYAAALMRATLRRLPAGTYRATDVLDDDGLGATRIPITAAIRIGGGRARIDFTERMAGSRSSAGISARRPDASRRRP